MSCIWKIIISSTKTDWEPSGWRAAWEKNKLCFLGHQVELASSMPCCTGGQQQPACIRSAASRLWEVILVLYSVLVRHMWNADSIFGLPSTKQTRTCWNETCKGSQWWLRAWKICHMSGGWDKPDCSGEKAPREPHQLCIYIMWEVGYSKEDTGMLFVVLRDSTRDNGHKLNHRKFP